MVQSVALLVLCVSLESLLITAGKLKGDEKEGESKGYKKTLQEESQTVTRTSSVPDILREAVDSGWLDKEAVDRIENKQTHKVEGYFITSDTSVSQDETDIGVKALQLHNVFRLIHHSPPLTWSNALGEAARNMARQLAEQNAQIRDAIPVLNISGINFRVYGTRSKLPGQADDTYGENTIKLTSVAYHCDYGVQEATKRWYNQGQHFSFSSPQVDKDTSSFTQIVWKKSKQLGVGCAEKNGLLTHDLYIVALYNPAGNELPEVRENVQRPGKTHDVYGDIY